MKGIVALRKSHEEQIAAILAGDVDAYIEALDPPAAEEEEIRGYMATFDDYTLASAAWQAGAKLPNSLFCSLPGSCHCPTLTLSDLVLSDADDMSVAWDAALGLSGKIPRGYLMRDWSPDEAQLQEFSNVQLEAWLAFQAAKD